MDMVKKQKVNSYKFRKISSEMGKNFGKIKMGDEEKYSFLLFPMESNLIKLNRINQINDGRRVIEAARACLFIVDGYMNKIEYDFNGLLTDEASIFTQGLLMSFDPFVNKEVLSIISSSGVVDLTSADSLRDYFKTPIKCVLRIEKSAELWTKELGVNGYFTFLEETLGSAVKSGCDKMDFIIYGETDYNVL